MTVRLTPRASRDGIDGMEGGVLRVRLTTPPVDDRANEALIRFLAAAAGVPRRDVTLAAGRRGRTKIVRIGGVSAAELLRRLGL